MIAKRISLSLLAVGLVSLLVSAATFALFSATSSNVDNVFTAGTVTLGAPTDNLIDIAPIAPGDSGSAGTYSITYTGNLEAWLGLDTTLAGALVSCDGGGHFSASISDGTNSYNPNAANQVVGRFTNGQSVTFSVNYALARAAGNDCQGDSATLTMTVHAVQTAHNVNGTNTGPIDWN